MQLNILEAGSSLIICTSIEQVDGGLGWLKLWSSCCITVTVKFKKWQVFPTINCTFNCTKRYKEQRIPVPQQCTLPICDDTTMQHFVDCTFESTIVAITSCTQTQFVISSTLSLFLKLQKAMPSFPCAALVKSSSQNPYAHAV